MAPSYFGAHELCQPAKVQVLFLIKLFCRLRYPELWITHQRNEGLDQLSGHRENILSPEWTHLGVGFAVGSNEYYPQYMPRRILLRYNKKWRLM
ncbi:MAG: hypothetical protein SCK29_14860 [Bacillota bacterium]|nr:hypothetical protein [Bacillota bacterium]